MSTIFKKLFFLFSLFVFILFCLGSIFGIVILNRAKGASLSITTTTAPIYIYDKDRNLISTDSYYYEYCPITEINPMILHAFVSIEDRSFYKHPGFSIKRIVKSAWKNLISGQIQSGASTITQQYVKNAYLSRERTFSRKLNEIAYAIELEKNIPKTRSWKRI